MRLLTWFDTLNLIDVFNYYLVLAFFVSTGIRIRTYRAIVGLVFASPSRWPKLLQLVKKHRTIFLGWPMLLSIGSAFALMLGNSLAIRLVWASAKVTFEELWGRWLPLAAVILSGGLMLLLDCRAIFSVGPALRMVTFGFVNPRKIVGAEVQRVLVDANWIVIGGMWPTSLRIGMQLGFWPLIMAHLGIRVAGTHLTKERVCKRPLGQIAGLSPWNYSAIGEMYFVGCLSGGRFAARGGYTRG
jgi:hypothetical protein